MLEQVQDAKIWLSFHLTRWLRPRQRVLLDGLVRGLGRTTFTLVEPEYGALGPGQEQGCRSFLTAKGEGCAQIDRLIERIDEVIRLAPNPVGIGDFLIRVRVFNRPPESGWLGNSADWRRLLAHEYFLDSKAQNCIISRYHDWKHGDARQRLKALLCQHCAAPARPLIEVAVTSIGQLLVDLVREEKINLGPDWECDQSIRSALS